MKKILIANRGEIARRIIHTAQRMGIETVAVYSDPDANALHVREATQAVALGGAASADTYLRTDKLLAALPELPYACGLNTVALLAADVTDEPLLAVAGAIEVRRVTPTGDDWRATDALAQWWCRRLSAVEEGAK